VCKGAGVRMDGCVGEDGAVCDVGSAYKDGRVCADAGEWEDVGKGDSV